ncbi:PLDc N-terminal domain-containing protein [Clostridium sp. AM54-14XD]|uniref:PLDc N-terminal domain-containing protein n=1 Tax=Clostridium sp. AM54-14XD TaxID=2293037 RepID=UPI001FAAB024|nr:PLDc N-terminal domain-containing protein [Clostridium sp. AM54-14XD]
MVITCLLVAAQLIFFMVEVLKLQQYYVLVAAILHLLSFIAVMHLLLKDVNPSIKLAWIVPILMFPVLGGLLYLLYGHIIMPKKLEKYMKHAAEWDYETDLYANMAYFSDVIKGSRHTGCSNIQKIMQVRLYIRIRMSGIIRWGKMSGRILLMI